MLRTSDQFAYLSESEWALSARYVYKYKEIVIVTDISSIV